MSFRENLQILWTTSYECNFFQFLYLSLSGCYVSKHYRILFNPNYLKYPTREIQLNLDTRDTCLVIKVF